LKRPGTLQIALGVSVALHGLLLAVRLADPARFDRIFQDTPLEVILVNSQTKAPPDQARAIAQFSMAGGGTLDKGRASSPLPPSALTDLGEAADAAQRQIDKLQSQQMQLLTQLKQQLAALPPEVARMVKDPVDAAREEKRRQLVKILGEIEKRISDENERPQKRYVSPATREEAYAVYYDRLRRSIESLGTTAFPSLAGQKLYGELTLALTVNSSGQLLVSEVLQSSGNPALDRQAQSIAARAGPYGRFSPAMLRQADQIVVVSRFTFARDDTLQTRMDGR
jgi:protein TonB